MKYEFGNFLRIQKFTKNVFLISVKNSKALIPFRILQYILINVTEHTKVNVFYHYIFENIFSSASL